MFKGVWKTCLASSFSGTSGRGPGCVGNTEGRAGCLISFATRTFCSFTHLDKLSNPRECANKSVSLNASSLFIERLQKLWQLAADRNNASFWTKPIFFPGSEIFLENIKVLEVMISSITLSRNVLLEFLWLNFCIFFFNFFFLFRNTLKVFFFNIFSIYFYLECSWFTMLY